MVARLNDIAARAQAQLAQPKIFFTIAFVIAFALSLARAFMPFTSPFDEHTHLSYVQYAFNWQIPAEGYPMNTWAKDAFSCYAHALYGPMTEVPCGVHAAGAEYPTGGTNTSQIWPPLYFFIVAIFMRLPLLIGMDPLMSARVVTVALWSLGAAWLGVISLQKSRNAALSLGVVALLVALPAFYFYTSFVSPHSLDPLIAAVVIVVADRFLKSAELDFRKAEVPTFRAGLKSGLTNKWGYVLIGLSAVIAFAVPQALAALGFAAVYMLLVMLLSAWKQRPGWLASYATVSGIFTFLSVVIFFAIFKFWQWQKDFRAIPAASDVDPGRANIDPAEVVYSSPIERIIKLWWNFWPNGLEPGFPAGPDVTFVTTPWLIVITSLAVAAILFWKKRSWLGQPMLALFVSAPLFAVLYDSVFTTAVPVRYGLIFPIIGVLAFANRMISKWPRRMLLLAVIGTYLSAFALNYMFIYARGCGLDPVTRLITCN